MATKYVFKNKDGIWQVKNAKADKVSKNFATQKEAVAYASSLQGTTHIMLKDRNGKFRKVSGWDKSSSTKARKNKRTKKSKKTKKRNKTNTWVLWLLVIIGVGLIATLSALAIGGYL